MVLAGFKTSSNQQEQERKLKGKVENNKNIPTSTLSTARSNEKPGLPDV